MRRRLAFAFAPLLLVLSLLAGGCGSSGTPPPIALPPTVVSVAQLQEGERRDVADFTGRTEAVDSVEIKARATGYLEEVLFKEGDDVKKGQLLYKIDERTYRAELDKHEADIRRQEASVNRLNADLTRARRMRLGDAMSREEFDKITADKDEATAALAAARAAARRAELNLQFTRVTSPIDGRVSRTRITKGNLVTQDQTLLTTVVSLDPIRASFDVDERTVLQVQKKLREGKFKSYHDAEFPVYLGTQIEKGYPHKGHIDFVDNTIDPGTATLRVRGVFPNPDKVLQPGLFVRIRLPIGDERKALLVSERALGSDQGQRFLYVVNDRNEVEYRAVEVGSLRDGLRVLESGAKAGEWVIVNGLQRVRPGVTVDPKKVPMPVPVTVPVGERKVTD